MPSDEKAQFLLDIVEDRKAVDPVLLDLRGKTLLFDYFMVCEGTSNVHIRSIAEALLEKSEDARLPKPRVAGQENAEWVLLDFGDIVIHVMSEETRDRYKLEEFWSTPQPKGALPPTPDDLEDRDTDFFLDADRQVEPIDEDDEDDDIDEDDEAEAARMLSLDEMAEDEDDEDDADDDDDFDTDPGTRRSGRS